MVTISFYTDNLVATSGHKFYTDTACTVKQVKGTHTLLEIEIVG